MVGDHLSSVNPTEANARGKVHASLLRDLVRHANKDNKRRIVFIVSVYGTNLRDFIRAYFCFIGVTAGNKDETEIADRTNRSGQEHQVGSRYALLRP